MAEAVALHVTAGVGLVPKVVRGRIHAIAGADVWLTLLPLLEVLRFTPTGGSTRGGGARSKARMRVFTSARPSTKAGRVADSGAVGRGEPFFSCCLSQGVSLYPGGLRGQRLASWHSYVQLDWLEAV